MFFNMHKLILSPARGMFGGCTPNSKELLHSATVPTRTQAAKDTKKS